ncbi:hypothetical protein HN51_044584, partial [Arachis hypogaea]
SYQKTVGPIKTHGSGNLGSIASLFLDKRKTKIRKLPKTKLSASIAKNRVIL